MSELDISSKAQDMGLYSSDEQNSIGQVAGYESLELILTMAYQQAACGKGKERHASGLPFHDQPMQRESDDLESAIGLIYQARKKVREGVKLPSEEAQIKEVLGAINYLSGWVIWNLRHSEEEGGEGHVRSLAQMLEGSSVQNGLNYQVAEDLTVKTEHSEADNL